jgi:hypothetical protein
MKENHSTAVVLYHFFYPDDVVNARHLSDFAEELASRGWKVSILITRFLMRQFED